MAAIRRLSQGDLVALLTLVALVVALPALYVSAERVVYSSDHVGFQHAAVSTALELRERLGSGLRATLGFAALVWRSTGWDYSLFPAVLPAPVLLALQGGRATYVVTAAVLYLLPFVLLLGAAAAVLAPEGKRRAFWMGVCVAVAIPGLWVPVLHGYPDAGAAALVMAATVLFLRDMQLRGRWTPIGMGVCLAVAILFRRHFAYPALGLMAVIGAHTVLAAAARLRTRAGASVRRVLLEELSGSARLAMWFGGAMAILGTHFVVRALRTNYTTLYASYMLPPTAITAWWVEVFGWAAWSLAALGYLAAWHGRELDRRRLAVLLAVMLVTLALWTLRVRQAGAHYVLHGAPFIALGHFALVWAITRRVSGNRARLLALVGLASYAIVNGVRALAPAHAVPRVLDGTRALAVASPPLRWTEYDEIIRLVRNLRRIATRDDVIYVAASGHLRSSALRSADLMLDDPFRPGVTASDLTWGSRLNVPHTPHIDSRDGNPTSLLLRAKYVVVATPVQYHLSPDEQRIVRTAVEELTEDRPLARDFELLPGTYTLADGARVRVYRRTRPSGEAAALATFARFRAALGSYDRPLLTYLGVGPDVEVSGSGRADRAASIRLSSDTVALVLAEAVRRGSRLRASVRAAGDGCARARLSALTLAADGVASTGDAVEATQPMGAVVDVPLTSAGSAVLLHFWRDWPQGPDAGDCRLWISNVTVSGPA